MKIITQDELKKQLMKLWDSVMLISDEDIRQIAATAASTKEKMLVAKYEKQQNLLEMLDEGFADDLEMFFSEDHYNVLVSTSPDEESADAALEQLYKFITLLRDVL